MRLIFLLFVVFSGTFVFDVHSMKRKRKRGIESKLKRRKKIKKPLKKEEIKDRVSYFCTSLVQLASCEILKNYKFLLKKNWHVNLNFEVQEHLMRAMLYKEVLSSKQPNRCKSFLGLIADYKERNPNHSKKEILHVEQHIDRLSIVHTIKKRLNHLRYKSNPASIYLEENLTDCSDIVRFKDKNVQVVLGSFVYLFDPKCKKILYADGHENEIVTVVKYVILGKEKRFFIGYADGHVLFVPVGKQVLFGNVGGRVTDILTYQKDGEVARVAVQYKLGFGKKIRFIRAFEKREDAWLLRSGLHTLPQEVESMEFDEDQLITRSSDAQKIWDFVPNREGDLEVKNTYIKFLK